MNATSNESDPTYQDMPEITEDIDSKISETTGMLRKVSARTIELAKLAGRAPHQIRQIDYERAKREINGLI